MEHTLNATKNTMIIEAIKKMLGEFLVKSKDAPSKTLGLEELEPLIDRRKDMTSSSIKNKVMTFEYLRTFGVMDNMTKFKGLGTWAYMQKNMFLSQGEDEEEVFVFKMLEVRPGSGVNLVKRIQPRRDLEDAWIMFNHYKRVK